MRKLFDYGDCDRCGGQVSEQSVQETCSRKGRIVIIVEDVPAEVCTQCGERYFRSNVAEHLEAIAKDPNRSGKQINMPSLDF